MTHNKGQFFRFSAAAGIVLVSIVFGAFHYTYAHDANNTVVTLGMQAADTVSIEVVAPLEIMNAALGRELTNVTIPDNFSTYITDRVSLVSDGQRWGEQVNDMHVAEDYLYVTVAAQVPSGVATGSTTLQYRFLVDRVDTHRALVYSADVSQSTTFLGTIGYDNTTGEIRSLPVPIATEATTVAGWWRSVYLGFDHFRHGYDHMLFLLTILLVAPFVLVGRDWRLATGLRQVGVRLLLLSLAFTIGHSFSLLYGSFHNVLQYKDLIELLITITIAVSALHAWRPLFYKMDLVIVCGFGIVHGLAFASELALVDMPFWGRVTSVFGFNVGLELFQLAALCILLPVYIFLLRKSRPAITRQLLAGAAIVVSSYWMIERLWVVLG